MQALYPSCQQAEHRDHDTFRIRKISTDSWSYKSLQHQRSFVDFFLDQDSFPIQTVSELSERTIRLQLQEIEEMQRQLQQVEQMKLQILEENKRLEERHQERVHKLKKQFMAIVMFKWRTTAKRGKLQKPQQHLELALANTKSANTGP